MTVGADFCVKPIHLLDLNATIEFFIYDCAGQSYYNDLITQYVHDASLIVVVYDIHRSETLDKAKDWLDLIQRAGNDKLRGILIGIFIYF